MKTLLLLLLVPTFTFSQIGIGTSNPEATLHIAGNNSTIRIESLNAANNPTHNDGIKPSLAYVTALGDITLNPSTNNGTAPDGSIAPINFLLNIPNFIPNGPQNLGTIVSSPASETNTTGLITTFGFTSAGSALVEVKYSITSILSPSSNMSASLIPFNDCSERIFKIYFCLDIDDDGLTATELSKKYGFSSQSYASLNQGILGYSFTNGQGYTTVPPGTHRLYFFTEIYDGPTKVTSIGFGGAEDILKVRVYN
ncbi:MULTISPECIES: hypothetical protein [Flavobacterium]|uniref:hypothetical protein n=1 Tax=Flavobacterium TaxID=237 RepID=UPI001FCC54B0|nr:MULTISPECIES: hypothetical protein [Flavobacterium]UOK43245.1 hypothetical protein LZF87_03765 [Flavobacterium enshiense]